MAISVAKLVPSATVLAAVAYAVWPTVSIALWPPPPPAAEGVPDLAAALLVPKLPPLPPRDPFSGKLISQRRPVIVPTSTLPKKPVGRTVQEAAQRSRQAAEAKSASTLASAKRETLRGFTLQATSIIGDQRMAVINGRVYAVGDALRLGGRDAATLAKPDSRPPGGAGGNASPAGDAFPLTAGLPPGPLGAKSSAVGWNVLPTATAARATNAKPPPASRVDYVCKIVNVLPDRVLLELEGNQVELKYPDALPAPHPRRSGGASRAGRERSRAPRVEKARGNGNA